ncbi:hypothetical protein N7512_001558 [Penicillium capsulatum]|nr:hypothetical protein N7512_001558 [Penicillium capsulatum]
MPFITRVFPCSQLLLSEPAFSSPTDAFKGFDQGQHHTMTSSTVPLDADEEPRRGASRANSVRFDESAIHGYYGQASRSSTDLPLRTGSGMGSHPLTERSLSHRSDGRLSSSGHSLHSARTNSLGLDTSRLGSSFSSSPLIPPPGLYLLGPVPCIIRCWLTENFSNDGLLYAAVCSGSYVSSLSLSMICKLGLEESIFHEPDRSYIKIALHLPEASVHQAPHSGSPTPQLPSVTIKFVVRKSHDMDDAIQIIIGSDVLRSHNADILFSQDKIHMVDDEHNRISVPMVRPENMQAFNSLWTVPDSSHPDHLPAAPVNGKSPVGVVGQPINVPDHSTSAPASARVSIGEADDTHKPDLGGTFETPASLGARSTAASATDAPTAHASKPDGSAVWSSWRRDPKSEPKTDKPARGRNMTVLRPIKSANRVGSSSTSAPVSATAENHDSSIAADPARDTRSGNTSASNPIGGASAFGWLTSPSGPRPRNV